MESLIQFEVIFMDEVQEFLDSLAPESREKIVYNVRKVKDGYRDSELFKKMDGADNLWEFRTQYNGIQYRLLAFWDEQKRRLVELMDSSRRHGRSLRKKSLVLRR